MEGEDSGVGRGPRGGGGGQVVISSGVEAEMRPEMRTRVRPGPMIISQSFMMHFKSLKVLYWSYK